MRIDGELDSLSARTELEAHLAGCAVCRRFLERETERSDRLRAALSGSSAGDAQLEASLLRLAAQEPRGPVAQVLKGPSPVWRPWAAAAAVFLASGWVGWNFWPTGVPVPVDPHDVRAGVSIDDSAALHYVLEETLEDSQLVPDARGQPVRRDVERVRRWAIPSGDPGRTAPGRVDDVGRMRWEQINARNVKLVSWPYQ